MPVWEQSRKKLPAPRGNPWQSAKKRNLSLHIVEVHTKHIKIPKDLSQNNGHISDQQRKGGQMEKFVGVQEVAKLLAFLNKDGSEPKTKQTTIKPSLYLIIRSEHV